MPLAFALALFSASDLAMALAIGLEKPENALRGEWIRLVPMILVGTALGVTVLVRLPRQAAMAALGVFVLAFALYSFVRPHAVRTVGSGWAWLAGFAGGITSTLFGAGGPPYAIYLSHRGLSKAQFRATMGLATLTSISLRVIAFFATGLLLDSRVWLTAIATVPAALAGIAVARRVYFRISRDALLRAVSAVLLASGSSLLARALAG